VPIGRPATRPGRRGVVAWPFQVGSVSCPAQASAPSIMPPPAAPVRPTAGERGTGSTGTRFVSGILHDKLRRLVVDHGLEASSCTPCCTDSHRKPSYWTRSWPPRPTSACQLSYIAAGTPCSPPRGRSREAYRERIILTGDVPSPADPPFRLQVPYPRCPIGADKAVCHQDPPFLIGYAPMHSCACHDPGHGGSHGNIDAVVFHNDGGKWLPEMPGFLKPWGWTCQYTCGASALERPDAAAATRIAIKSVADGSDGRVPR
jgi:hypothetical protein